AVGGSFRPDDGYRQPARRALDHLPAPPLAPTADEPVWRGRAGGPGRFAAAGPGHGRCRLGRGLVAAIAGRTPPGHLLAAKPGAGAAPSGRPVPDQPGPGTAGAGQPAAVPEWPGQPLKEHAAGNLQALAGDPAIAFFQQQGYGGADVVGQADTPQRGIAGDESIDLLVVAYDAATEIGLDGAWCQDVHANAVRAQFLGLVAGQYLHRPLHGGVGGIAGQGETG